MLVVSVCLVGLVGLVCVSRVRVRVFLLLCRGGEGRGGVLSSVDIDRCRLRLFSFFLSLSTLILL